MKSIIEHKAAPGRWCVEPPLADGAAYSLVARNMGSKPIALADVLPCTTDEETKATAHTMALASAMMLKLHQVSQWMQCVLDGTTDPIGHEASRRYMRSLCQDITFLVDQTKGK
jgi:hypothetical protein